jgi:Cdc6-like AAA superfamily ATPase
MSNPKDWFRRRPALNGAGGPSVDPFSGDAVLDLGHSAAAMREPPLGDATGHRPAERRGAVPPPPPSPPPRREGPALDRGAFTVRPEIVRPRSAEIPRPVGNGASAFALRRAPTAPITLRPQAEAKSQPEPEAKPLPEAKPQPVAVPPPRETTRAAIVADNSEHAAFTLAAPGVSWKRSRSPVTETGGVSARLRDAFTPTRPKQNAALFSGRYKQMQRIIAAIEEERAHIVLYGERGSGKTSLANVLAGKAEDAGYFVLRLACNSELSFEDIFRGLLRRMPASLLPDGIGATSRAGVDNFDQLAPGRVGVAELVALFERIYEKHVILIIDEYDRITAEDTKAKFAEIIKNMSDSALPVTLLIIGVADNVRELLGKHPSLQRTLVTIPMPLMTRREIDGIIACGEEKTGLRFDPAVRQQIADFAQGLPYHAQLLCLFAARNAVRRQSSRVEREDLRYAVQRTADEAELRIKEAYDLAIGPHDNASFRDVLFYAARCRSDEFGSFTATDVAAVAGRATGEGPEAAASLLALQYPLKKLTEPERGAVLRRIVGPGGLRYQFSSQMLRHHVLVRQAEQRKLI